MNDPATHRRRASWLVLLIAVPLALVAGRANAQVDPLWDHYKVYVSTPIPPPPNLVDLSDQFGRYLHSLGPLEWFMNPTSKRLLPPETGLFEIIDPDLHYAWWGITPQPFTGVVTTTNQFGDFQLNVFDAVYLLNPARKNQPGLPPIANHYKCYSCEGPAVQKPVELVDQFGPWQTQVMFPRFFCNPVNKSVLNEGGTVIANSPIIDPDQHYTCYDIQPEDPNPHSAAFSDQFVSDATITMQPGRLLCVPTLKHGVTSSQRDTWGKLKLLYR